MSLPRHRSTVLRNRELATGTYELELSRGNFQFRAGEEIILHGEQPEQDRTYSLASGEQDQALKLLIRVIPDGVASPRWARLQPGGTVEFTGPTGSFILREPIQSFWFIATGTGIAPLLSYLRTDPTLRPVVLHGVRNRDELYYRTEIEARCAAYHPCVSRDPEYPLRVTDVLAEHILPPETDFYLCGGQPMIRDARAILLERGVAADRIRTEAYFFW